MSSITRQKSLLELSLQSQAAGTNTAVKSALEITDYSSQIVAISGSLSQDIYNLDFDLQSQINALDATVDSISGSYLNANGDTMVGDLVLAGQIYTDDPYGNEAFGKDALQATLNSPGFYTGNTAVGFYSQKLNSGQSNTTVGAYSLDSATGSSANTAIGYSALTNCISGSANVAIGYQAGYYETGDAKLYISNTNATSGAALIYGEFDNGKVWIAGNPIDTFVTLGSAPTPTTAGKKGQIGVYSGTAYLWTGDATVVKWTVTESW